MKMKVLLVHNFYPVTGGEESVLLEEKNLLEQAGHAIVSFYLHTKERGIRDFLLCGSTVLWNPYAYHRIRRLIQMEKPDIVHCHNTFPMISPSVYWACLKEGVPVVQTLHNYRLLCANAAFLRAGKVCEDCLGKRFTWPAVRHRCYRGSLVGSLLLSLMQWLHRSLGTWRKTVDTYIALTDFSKSRFIESGLIPEGRIVVKPNFLGTPPGPATSEIKDRTAVFAGRLSVEKGCRTLVQGWITAARKSENLDRYTLYIIGDGPEREDLERLIEAAGDKSDIRLLGMQSRDNVLARMRTARFMVLPSVWYEGFPMTILESFACGVPVISSEIGSMPSIIDDGLEGLFFAPGDENDLAEKLVWAVEHEEEMRRMGRAARERFDRLYNGERNYRLLREIYEQAAVRTNCGAEHPV